MRVLRAAPPPPTHTHTHADTHSTPTHIKHHDASCLQVGGVVLPNPHVLPGRARSHSRVREGVSNPAVRPPTAFVFEAETCTWKTPRFDVRSAGGVPIMSPMQKAAKKSRPVALGSTTTAALLSSTDDSGVLAPVLGELRAPENAGEQRRRLIAPVLLQHLSSDDAWRTDATFALPTFGEFQLWRQALQLAGALNTGIPWVAHKVDASEQNPSTAVLSSVSRGIWQAPDAAIIHARALSEASSSLASRDTDAEKRQALHCHESSDSAGVALHSRSVDDVTTLVDHQGAPKRTIAASWRTLGPFMVRRTALHSSRAPASNSPWVAASSAGQSHAVIDGRPVLFVQVR
jgi:hypothetical protein